MDNLEQFELKRQEILAQYKKQNGTAFLLIIPAILFLVLGFILELPLLFILTIGLGIPGFIFFGKASILRSTFRKLIKNELITALLKDEFDDVYYDAKSSIPISRITQTGMVKRPDRSSAEDYIKGRYKGVEFEVCDINLKERVETRDAKGNTTVTYQTYFKGRWYIYKFERKFDEELRIVEGRGYGISKKNLVKIDTESMIFNKKFAIYASSQEYGFYHITSSMIEKLLELEKLHRGSILYYFVDDELHIGVNDGKDYMEISMKTPINKESLKSFMSDIELIPAIINELRLDSIKFKKTL
ncbi:MAG: DUF3137 domain-containing protein [Acholeplasmataceae bacterium]|nr:DUF3137 domain-containing protein [Acholeplasmataceae bacterium]